VVLFVEITLIMMGNKYFTEKGFNITSPKNESSKNFTKFGYVEKFI